MKKIVGLDIDEVFRAFIETFHHFYEKEFDLKKFDKFGEQIEGYECNYHTNKLDELFKFKETVRKTRLIVSDIDVVYSSNPKFEDEEHFISKEMALNIFKYEDYLMELYGTCPKTYTHVGLDLSKLVEKYLDNYEFRFIIKDKRITIGPTLFFLSTLRPVVTDYKFVNNIEDVWNLCDVYITANPDFIGVKPQEKNIIMVNMPYNQNKNIEKRIDKLGDLLENNLL
jgi:hypothetical protein